MKNKRKARITFDEYDAAHLYELALEHFFDRCADCPHIKKRLEDFIGKSQVRWAKKVVKNNPYCKSKQ